MIATLLKCALAAALITTTGATAPASPSTISAEETCRKIGRKLASVSAEECLKLNLRSDRWYSVKGQPLILKEYPAAPDAKDPNRVLFISGIHGDEYSSISVAIKWLSRLDREHDGRNHWLTLPLVNPDGLLRKGSTRTNANGVDLNRNFQPSDPAALDKRRHRVARRYYPGDAPLSEPESLAIHQLINEFKPDVIFSVHAPHDLVDFDGDHHAPKELGPLRLRQLGTYPGSLGNYAWVQKGIPVITIELAYAGIMPSPQDINDIWDDMLAWLQNDLPDHQQRQLARSKGEPKNEH